MQIFHYTETHGSSGDAFTYGTSPEGRGGTLAGSSGRNDTLLSDNAGGL